MKLIEFVVFIARVAHELYKHSKQESKPLHLKIDHVLGPLLGTIDL